MASRSRALAALGTSRVLRPIAPLLLIIPLQVRGALPDSRTAGHAVGVDLALDVGAAVERVRVQTVLGAHAVGARDVVFGTGEVEGWRGGDDGGEEGEGEEAHVGCEFRMGLIGLCIVKSGYPEDKLVV